MLLSRGPGLTAFMFACRFEHKDVVQLLLEHQVVVDINIPESFQLSEDIQNLIESHSMRLQTLHTVLEFHFCQKIRFRHL